MKGIYVRLLFIPLFLSCFSSRAQLSPIFEFRAVWVASVENIDWPSRKGLSTEEQKAEFIHLLDLSFKNGMNTIIMQIRPAADALYPSAYEPWSEYLTGTQGLPPSTYYDPLAFMIEETHKRGMEFHAWLNPYRAVFNLHKSSVSPSHITRIHPEWFLIYGDKKYFNPGLPQVWNYFNNIVKDIVSRYKIDGIHMDDYFYPYRITGKEFPDEQTYEHNRRGLNKEDWRRSNCDSVIKLISATIKSTNNRVKFGISPFGVWRNKDKDPEGSNTKAGQTNYDDLYANILLWLQKGWIDYVVPQLYWEQGHKLCDFTTLLDWWDQHTYGRQLYIGHALYRAGSNAAWRNKMELSSQIKTLRSRTHTMGSVYFSYKNLENNINGWSDTLRLHYYSTPALIPPMPWIDSISPSNPIIEKIRKNNFRISYTGHEKIKGYAIALSETSGKPDNHFLQLENFIANTKITELNIENYLSSKEQKIYIAAVSQNNNISDWIELK